MIDHSPGKTVITIDDGGEVTFVQISDKNKNELDKLKSISKVLKDIWFENRGAK